MDKATLERILEKIDTSKYLSHEAKSHDLAQELQQRRRPLGELLLERNKISKEQLESALHEQAEKGNVKLGQILLSHELIEPNILLATLAEQLDLPFYDTLPYNEIDPSLVKDLSRSFCLQNLIVPVSRDNFGVTVAVADPLELSAVDDLRLVLGTTIFRIVCPKSVIETAINNVFERQEMVETGTALTQQDDEDTIEGLDNVQDLLDDEEDAPIRREVSRIIRRAVSERASDIHIEPYEDKIVVRFRIDGRLREITTIPKKHQSAIATRIKIMGRLDISESRIPQDGRIPLKVGGKDCDVRLSCLPTKWGERIVMRIQDKSKGIMELEKLGMPEEMYRDWIKILKQEHGIILVTGPTGSGKTATLASCLMYINRPDLNIITIEDPVEIIIPGAGQVEVNEKAGLTFANALRSILRQDPNVILIQEIRDSETALIAVQAAITGHLVLSTLHTNDTATSITRLTDLGVQNYQIASSVIGILAVRLIRQLCTTCKEPHTYTPEELMLLGITPERALTGKTCRARPNGCPQCKNTGYMGRFAIFELLKIDDEIRNYILKSSDGAGLKKLALSKGMITLRECAARRFLAGDCTLEDALAATQTEE